MGGSGKEDSERRDQLGELANLIVRIARKIDAHRLNDPHIAPLTQVEALLLRYIDDNTGVTPSALASAAMLRTSNVSAALRALESRGLVAREPDPTDGRISHLRATKAARESMLRVREEWGRLLEGTDLDRPEVLEAIRLLDALDEALT